MVAHKGGRPRKTIDLALVENLARIGCSDQDIAEIARIHPSTFYRRKNKEGQLSEALKKGRANMRMSLRRWQFKAAESGNPALLIWLGRQHLAQTDKLDVGIVSDDTLRAEVLRRGMHRVITDRMLLEYLRRKNDDEEVLQIPPEPPIPGYIDRPQATQLPG